MTGITKTLIRLTVHYGLGVVLSISGMVGFAWFGWFTVTENAKRELGYQQIIGRNQEAILDQLKYFSNIELQQTALLQKHDERSKDFLDNEGTRRERLVIALEQLNTLINRISQDIRDAGRTGRRGG